MTRLQEQALKEGANIGVYQIKRTLNAAQFGITYRAWNHHLNALVAIKEYFPCDFAVRRQDGYTVGPKSDSDRAIYEYGLESFLEQAEILAQIKHRSVVRVHNALQFNGTGYLIMEYEDGLSLSRLCDLPSLVTEAELRGILMSLLDALQEVHERGAVHGDIHPENILVRGNGEPVLISFATARLAIASRRDMLQRELRIGYAPAEQYDPGNRSGPATDLYALGATMYRCITQTEPRAALDRVSALRKSGPDPLKSLVGSADSTYSEGLLKTVDWMLRPDVKDRPQSASEVVAALSPRPEEAQPTETRHEQRDSDYRFNRAYTAPPRVGLWISGVMGVAALSATVFWYLQQDEQRPETLALNTERQTAPALMEKDMNEQMAGQPQEQSGSVDRTPPESRVEPKAAPALGKAEREALEAEQELASTKEILSPTGEAAVMPPVPQRPSKAESLGASTLGNGSKSMDGLEAETTEMAQQLPLEAVPASQPNRQPTIKAVASKDTIEWHMAAAEEDLTALRLTTPVGDNAYEHYQVVLAVEPGHAEAHQGLQRIVDRYVWLIGNAIQDGRLNTARIYLARAEAVLPDAASLENIRTELTAAEQ